MRELNRDARLRNFFAAYFNQDWAVEGAHSWQDVLHQFLADNGEVDTATLRDALASWLEEATLDGQNCLPSEFGCDFDPQSDGLNARQWVGKIVDEFNRLLRN